MTEPENTPTSPPAIPRVTTNTASILRAQALLTPAALREELDIVIQTATIIP